MAASLTPARIADQLTAIKAAHSRRVATLDELIAEMRGPRLAESDTDLARMLRQCGADRRVARELARDMVEYEAQATHLLGQAVSAFTGARNATSHALADLDY